MNQEEIIEQLRKKIDEIDIVGIKELLTELEQSNIENIELSNQEELAWKELVKDINKVLEE